MRLIALIKRVLTQMRRSPRTIGLMFIAPIFILSLMYVLLANNNTVNSYVGTYNLNHQIAENLETKHLKLSSTNSDRDIQKQMKDHNWIAFIDVSDKRNIAVTYQNSDLGKTQLVKNSLKASIMKLKSKDLISNLKVSGQALKAQKQAILTQQKALKELAAHLPAPAKAKMPKPANKHKVTQKIVTPTDYKITSHYIYAGANATFFDQALPALVTFFVFFFVFLISGISLLSERTSGTLSRLLATPIRRSEIIFGYIIGYGIFAIIQTLLIVCFTVFVLNVHIVGNFWLVFLTNVLVAFVALTMGIFASTFAQNEFQMMQFIPLLVIPQVFFSGIIPLAGMAQWLQWIAHIMPMYYAGNTMINVITKGYLLSDVWPNLVILAAFGILFTLLNILGMRRFRQV